MSMIPNQLRETFVKKFVPAIWSTIHHHRHSPSQMWFQKSEQRQVPLVHMWETLIRALSQVGGEPIGSGRQGS